MQIFFVKWTSLHGYGEVSFDEQLEFHNINAHILLIYVEKFV